jgi:hypothetical protein
MRKVVGISQKIKRTWLDGVLDRLAQTADDAALRAYLEKQLKGDLPGAESRAKAAGILLRVWTGIPTERVALRDRALAMLPRIAGQERIWLHWGMTALAYPFFRDTAEVVGRLLALQDDFTTAQVQGRILTTWGDRATSKEAAQKLITSMVDWEVLRSTKTKGRFLRSRKITASIPELETWLLEALLAASASDEIEAKQLLRLPESFPFTIGVGVADLRRHEGFNIHRQGLDMDMVGLRKVKVEPTPKPTKYPKKGKATRTDNGSLFDTQAAESVLSNGKHDPVPQVPLPARTESVLRDPSAERRRIEDSIKNEVLQTLSDRVDRFLQVHGTTIVPDVPFAAPSVECAKQFRDGHYFGCIALAHAVLEAVIRHVWQVKFKRKPNREGSFETNLEALHKKKFIGDECKAKLDRMWADRHSYCHLRLSVEFDQQKLEATARSTLALLNDAEKEFFGYTLRDGQVLPHHPEYWSINKTSEPSKR